MAQVTLDIGGNSYTVACRDGEEDHVRAIAAIVNTKAIEAKAAVGSVSEVRQLLLASLLLADELEDTKSGNLPVQEPVEAGDTAELLEEIATRLESLASTLENAGQHA
ncbi:MAG: cell division protein ZapA [Chakrabartia sp.]